MVRKEQAKIGARVMWQSLDATIPPTYGTITGITSDGRAEIDCDDGETSDTYVDSGASCWHVVQS